MIYETAEAVNEQQQGAAQTVSGLNWFEMYFSALHFGGIAWEVSSQAQRTFLYLSCHCLSIHLSTPCLSWLREW
jgi:hypothetical protein